MQADGGVGAVTKIKYLGSSSLQAIMWVNTNMYLP